MHHPSTRRAANEFRGLTFETELPTDVATGEQALHRIGFGDSSVPRSLAGLGRIMLFNWMFTFHTLRAKKPAYQFCEGAGDSTHM